MSAVSLLHRLEHRPGEHRFNEDRERAFDSLARLDDLDADVVLFGHSDPWTQGVPRALELVRDAAGRRLRRSASGTPAYAPRWAPLVLLDLGGSGRA